LNWLARTMSKYGLTWCMCSTWSSLTCCAKRSWRTRSESTGTDAKHAEILASRKQIPPCRCYLDGKALYRARGLKEHPALLVDMRHRHYQPVAERTTVMFKSVWCTHWFWFWLGEPPHREPSRDLKKGIQVARSTRVAWKQPAYRQSRNGFGVIHILRKANKIEI
jgi:hypothetical protein